MIILAMALATVEPPQIAAFGIGQRSCATAFSSDSYLSAYTWVMGYFTGINAATNAQVGHSVVGDQIVAQVRSVCRENSSLLLIDAAEQVYLKMREAGS